MSNVEYGLKNALNRVEKFLQRLRGEPEVKRTSENRAARYERELAQSVALSGPTGGVGNEQLRYGAVKETNIPVKENRALGSYLEFEKQTQVSNTSCEMVYEEENKESKCVLIQVAGSLSKRDRKPIPLPKVDRFL